MRNNIMQCSICGEETTEFSRWIDGVNFCPACLSQDDEEEDDEEEDDDDEMKEGFL